MEVARKVDVAIIGGGLAGSAMAILLARAGVSVALLERSKFPRDKVCGEFLSWDASPILEMLGVSTEIAGLRPPAIRTCRIPSADYSFELPGIALGLSRLALDEMLFRRAAAVGAETFEEATVTKIDPASRSLHATSGSGEVLMRCRVLIGAWGRWGRFDRELERSFVRATGDRYFGFKRHFSTQTSRESIDLHSFERGYLGVSPVEGNRVNICGLVHESRIKALRGGWDSFVEEIRREDSGIDDLFSTHVAQGDHYLTTEPVIFRPKSPTAAGVYFAGDAAAQIDPLTGNGMAMALQSAVLLLPFVMRELRGDSTASAAYEQAHRDFFASRIRWSRVISSGLRRPALMQTAARLLPLPAAGSFLARRTRASGHQIEDLLDRAEIAIRT